jgi:hypothetical protein
MAQWSCRLCGFSRYHRVAVIKNGQRYETSFFACSGCSVMFLNDSTFNGLHLIPEAEVPTVVTPLRRRR